MATWLKAVAADRKPTAATPRAAAYSSAAAGSAALDQSDILLNLAFGGLAGKGGSDGDGIGGGLYVTTGGVVTLKKTTVALNFASFSNNNIYGTVTYL